MTDPFDTAKSTYTSKDDIKDCLIAYIATGPVEQYTASDQSNAKPGEVLKYDFIKSAIVVLDGKPSEEFVKEHGKTLPVLLDEFGFSGVKLIDTVKHTLKTHKPKVGRLRHSKNKRGGWSFSMEEPTPADLQIARKHVEMIMSLVELQPDDEDPFDKE